MRRSSRYIMPFLYLTPLSPPSAKVSIEIPFTIVAQFPIRMPESEDTVLPFCIKAMSLVVPPISTITASSASASSIAPITLAAGPHSNVSTGRFFAYSLVITLPSLFTMTMGKSIPISSKDFSIASKKLSITGKSLALSKAVAPLFWTLIS